jgi:hypothetical protein
MTTLKNSHIDVDTVDLTTVDVDALGDDYTISEIYRLEMRLRRFGLELDKKAAKKYVESVEKLRNSKKLKLKYKFACDLCEQKDICDNMVMCEDCKMFVHKTCYEGHLRGCGNVCCHCGQSTNRDMIETEICRECPGECCVGCEHSNYK